MSFNIDLSLTLGTPDDDGVSLSQTPGAAGNLTITGAFASGGVATLSPPQFIGVKCAGNDAGRTFTIYGTDWNGTVISESVAGANIGTTNSTLNYKTVTRIAVDAATAGAISVGTVGVGTTEPMVLDTYVNPATRTAAMIFSGTANATLQVALNDLKPNWDIYTTTPTWLDVTGFPALAAHAAGLHSGSYTMIRLKVNSGTGAVQAIVNTPYISN